MSLRKDVPPTVVERDTKWGDKETHPSWGMIGVSKVSNTAATLFDSDIQHRHTVAVRISTATRRRDLNRDHLFAEQEFVEVEMSEAQWASFVSSPGSGNGVPCTIRRREDEVLVPGMPPDPRLHTSIEEVRGAADKAFAKVQEAFDTYNEKRTAENRRSLEAAIRNAASNVAFAGQSLTEHAENVVQRSKADIEAMARSAAEQLGLNPGEFAAPVQLMGGEVVDSDDETGAS